MSTRSAQAAQTMSPRQDPRERFEVIQGGAAPSRLRIAVVERLVQVLKDVHGRLATFLKNPGRLGAVHLPLVLSESSVTYELWKAAPASDPELRSCLTGMLGVAPGTDDASLLRALMAEVHQGFLDFRASRPGAEILEQYEEVLQGYELANVLPIVPGHDTGPMMAELARLEVAHDQDFTRSLLVSPRLLAAGLTPEEGSTSQVMVAGLTVAQLGTLTIHLRKLNPLLSNRQVCQLLLLAATDLKKSIRKSLGQAEVDHVQELARQLLRLQVVELLFV